MSAPAKQKSAARTPRPDGDATRALLLETAGQVFAERGFADGTSKEICERAGTPMASVNYHFGSREALYEAVLIEAHRQVMALDDLLALTHGPGDPKQKLRLLLARLIGFASQGSAPWGFRVVLREIMTPTAAVSVLIDKAIRPKSRVLLGLIGEVLDLPPEHPAVQRGLMFALLPCLVILVAPKEVPARVLPAVAKESGGLADDFIRYAMAGLEAMAAVHRPQPDPAAKPGRGARRAPSSV
ncbi:TetR/AcrR family transcriptional regulator [Variovorax ginsengisoli]|uniref:CerR family C-terminal domain-containing protein n=1 Tax=Variovorax ginsengisoli TaxID=363844 RepID=A0ABT8RXW8_9BURK|nr:CerR family C-terminal domain-containing protein [Variovorax ginsengisoli]MDN8612336.1 CerR family C-terminal domain-containing protein [Variovorax ginsengisoli]MDO1531506.1 CerR family C-terminal domain-containing protein [Variovorax ginsengisoli]